uniref:[RNA-polymerase]-subunit kinase n=1 Tax=Lygus hesperus TaxID=30085 RepID=A0A0A9WEC1_LYGHE
MKFIQVTHIPYGLPHPVARELLIAQRVRCPFIVRTEHILAHGSAMVLIMEHCDNDIARLLMHPDQSSHPLPWPDTIRLFYMLLRALHYLHARHILHRDVKPSNCFLTLRHGTGHDRSNVH